MREGGTAQNYILFSETQREIQESGINEMGWIESYSFLNTN